jgi:hypothetical protein
MDQNFEHELNAEFMKDTSFSVYSDPKFLYIMGKICARSQLLVYSDLAIQSFHDYFLIKTYYKRSDEDYARVKIKTFVWLARVFLDT